MAVLQKLSQLNLELIHIVLLPTVITSPAESSAELSRLHILMLHLQAVEQTLDAEFDVLGLVWIDLQFIGRSPERVHHEECLHNTVEVARSSFVD